MADREAFDAKELTQLEWALGSLAPRPSGIDRDRLLFLAGRASVEPAPRTWSGRWVWPAATLLSSTVAVMLLGLLMTRPAANGAAGAVDMARDLNDAAPSDVSAQRGERNTAPGIIVRQQASTTRRESLPPFGLVPFTTPQRGELPDEPNYLQLRSYVLAHGVEALPIPTSSGTSSESPARSASQHRPSTQRELLEELLRDGGPMRQHSG